MENASNALRIAGGVLIGILVLSLLVAGYYNIRSYMAVEQTEENQQQVANFNKQFDIYVKDVYGSDVLSLVNKALDYNIRETENKGYQRFDVQVTFKVDVLTDKIDNVKYGFKKSTTYSTKKNEVDDKKIINVINTLIEKKNFYGNKEYCNYPISQLALMRTDKLEETIKNENNTQKDKIRSYIVYYNDLYSTEKKIKSTIFRFVEAKYDSNTGRMTLIKYKYTGN